MPPRSMLAPSMREHEEEMADRNEVELGRLSD